MAEFDILISKGSKIPKNNQELRTRDGKMRVKLFRSLSNVWALATNRWAAYLITRIGIETGQSAGTFIALIMRTRRFTKRGLSSINAKQSISSRIKRESRKAKGFPGQADPRTFQSGVSMGRSGTFSLTMGSAKNPNFNFSFKLRTFQLEQDLFNKSNLLPEAEAEFIKTVESSKFNKALKKIVLDNLFGRG